ncbi:MAG: hypothetical protein ABR928_01095 [Terracidiphilus sp.]|jgi:hypothetical protein
MIRLKLKVTKSAQDGRKINISKSLDRKILQEKELRALDTTALVQPWDDFSFHTFEGSAEGVNYRQLWREKFTAALPIPMEL